MEKIKNKILKFKNMDKSKKENLLIIFIIIGVILSIIINNFVLNKEDSEFLQSDNTNENVEKSKNLLENDIDILEESYKDSQDYQKINSEEYKIYVHVAGAVKNPGVIELHFNDRLDKAISKAGGVKENAELKYINLAKKLNDGEKVYIPIKGEYNEEDMKIGSQNQVLPGYNALEKSFNTDSINSSENFNQTDNKININNANKDELQKIDGVGESTANKIIQYRKENGRFEKIEEIKNIDGIGDKKFENIKDKIVLK